LRSFNLSYVDFPGTNDNPYTHDHTFAELSQELKDLVSICSGTRYVLGHSFGGLFAADCLASDVCDGVVCVATPLSNDSLGVAGKNYGQYESEPLRLAGEEWGKKQDDASFAKWLSEYGPIYFKNNCDAARNLMLHDKVSAAFFKANRKDAADSKAIDKEALLKKLATSKGAKLFIAGAEDKLLPENVLKLDALRGGFDFISVPDASHFVTFDRPAVVASLIEEKLLRQKQLPQ